MAACFRLRQMCSQREERQSICRAALNVARGVPLTSGTPIFDHVGLVEGCLVGVVLSRWGERRTLRLNCIRRPHSDLVEANCCHWTSA